MSRQSPPPNQGSTPPAIFNSQQSPETKQQARPKKPVSLERTADSRASLRSGKQMVI
ncbi:hypothetical protein THARTR1_03328 [Trichoderma harzianum]|uniref:Uncharacterized protein n=1 Tax=Trichoderma harzianum TaxID=5544 RepID=A0A2K0UFT3_TRIHA|nr:hypothetical protein THARTR1_03328 [Trichoderma harzianum]